MKEKFDKRKWLTLVGFGCFVLGLLFGLFIVWVNDNWTPWWVPYF